MKKIIKIMLTISALLLCFFCACANNSVEKNNEINNEYLDLGKSNFTDEEKTLTPFEKYSELDELGRCQTAFALICKEILPTSRRESIGMIKPSGWQTPQTKYDFVDGKYLYNRCHLIAFELAGENANEKNLVTGTRYMNLNMVPFENKVCEHVKNKKHHVLYRSTPIFKGDDLLCRGIQLEAYCMECEGKDIDFNIFVYNIQPGVKIDYKTGKNELQTDENANPLEDVINFE